ncbi:Npun_R1517 family heterocyst differentiation transcriptional regulator [Synechocystis sp. PCC 7509]|uniref:Npun_R1517 family heterocyst differentiation transcriptional regulator n=1 Tax=Synechocystis sp. PCC 7509 TaxID=927677 RepID=UPI0002ACBE23|nr:Npun_R1517 family heterocyst differentiation transcriptional regulator [Synechocystis sp. PCC 7509]
MKSDKASLQQTKIEVGVYECEIHLKFRLIEDKTVFRNPSELLDFLIESFIIGADDYLEPLQSLVKTQEISEVEASPQMRRQLMRLRNSSELG